MTSRTRKVKTEAIRQMLNTPGVRVEVGEPFPFRGDGRFMCLAKFVVPRYRILLLQSEAPPIEEQQEATSTMCIVSGQGATPEEARQSLMERLGEARRLPAVVPAKPRRGWLGRLIKAFG